MGNKQGRSKSTSDVPTAKKRKKSRNGSVDNTDTRLSCPELGGAVPYRSALRDDGGKNRDVRVTIYRSYRDLGRNKSPNFKDGNEPVDYKLYRRSARFPSMEKPHTLPRNFGRSKSAAYPERSAMTPNGDVPSFPGLPEKESILRSGRSSTRSSSKRPSRNSSANSGARKSTTVMPSDFPSTGEIKAKLAQYEDLFTKHFAARFCDLPRESQLSCVIVALDTCEENRLVSLQEYMEADDGVLPIDLTSDENCTRFILTIPVALFHGIAHVRRDKIADPSLWTSLARDLIMCVAIETANELTRTYEYQIALMYDDVAMRVIAEHAVECVMEQIQNEGFIDRNTAIHSVVNTYPQNVDGSRKFISGVVGTTELKWDLYELYKKPGLRKELNLQTDEYLNDSGIDSPGLEYQPWQFYYCDASEPFLYGYRGQTIAWDYVSKSYRLDVEEDVNFKREIAYQPDDFHRMYMPYKRLVGYEVMQTYCNKPAPAEGDRKSTLADTIKTDVGDGPAERDEIQPVYRPLIPHRNGLNYDNAVLDNTDLTRADMKDADLTETSAQNATLLLAELDMENMETSKLDGADISYSNLQARELSPNSLKVVTARHVLLSEIGDSLEGEPDAVHSPGSLPSPRSPGLNTSFVSDGEGNVFTVPQVIEQQKVRAQQEEEEKRKADEEAAKRKQEDEERRVLVVREKIKDSDDVTDGTKPVLRKKKKSKKKKRVDEIAVFMNQSCDSEGAHSVTDYNILDERPVTVQPAESGRQAYRPEPNNTKDYPYKSFVNGEKHNKSMDDVLDYTQSLPYSSRYEYPNKSEEVLVEQKSTTLHHTPAPIAHGETNGAHNDPSQQPPSPTDRDERDFRQPIYSRYSNVEKRPHRITPRIVKSYSAHGHLVGAGKGMSLMDPYGLGSLSGRRMLSQSELEYLRRSQIFTLLKGLQIDNLDPILPPLCDPFLGRKEEKYDIADLLSASGRIITLTGCPGIGKSNLAIAVANELIKKYVNPVHIDCRSCRGLEGVRLQLMRTFRLFFKSNEMDFFYNWVNSHEQRMLFVFDNLELSESLDSDLSTFMDSLLFNVKNLRILSTSRHQFFRGHAMHETYRVGDIREYSEKIMDMLVPDLHEEGKASLVEAADHILFGIYLCGKAFAIANVDAGKLYEDLSSPKSDGFNTIRLQDAIYQITTNELEQDRLFKLSMLVRKVLEHLPMETIELLAILSKIPADFELGTASSLTTVDSESLQDYVDELANLGLLLQNGTRYSMPFSVKLVVECCWPDNGVNVINVVKHYVEKLKDWNDSYSSVDCFEAIEQTRVEYTNIVWILRWLIEHEDTYEYCSTFADMDYAMFLCDLLPQRLYEDLYESLGQQAEEQNDVVTKTNSICCLAYKSLQSGRYGEGKTHAESAYETLHAAQLEEKDKAFCMLCLGKAYWEDAETRDKGVALVRSALDIYKQFYTLKDIKAIFANEEYGRILAEKESYQRARHIFNLSDLVMKEAVDKHPFLIPSYDRRRAIWDTLFLFGRATEISQKAVDVARLFYGDHPVTANMLTRLCDCIMKRGSLKDGIQACIDALGIRIKVLGDHSDTALSYKSLAYLMLRSGQYDEAVRFAQCALDIYEKVDAKEKYKIDARHIMAQARNRLENRSSVYLEINSRNASKTNITDLHNQSCVASFSTEV